MATALESFKKEVGATVSGISGSIIASFSVALGVSVLTESRWTIVTAGIIFGIAGSLANVADPFAAKANFLRSRISIRQAVNRLSPSFSNVFIIIFLPLLPYLLIDYLAAARIISLATGLILLFIFGARRVSAGGKKNPARLGFLSVLLGLLAALIALAVARYYIFQ